MNKNLVALNDKYDRFVEGWIKLNGGHRRWTLKTKNTFVAKLCDTLCIFDHVESMFNTKPIVLSRIVGIRDSFIESVFITDLLSDEPLDPDDKDYNNLLFKPINIMLLISDESEGMDNLGEILETIGESEFDYAMRYTNHKLLRMYSEYIGIVLTSRNPEEMMDISSRSTLISNDYEIDYPFTMCNRYDGNIFGKHPFYLEAFEYYIQKVEDQYDLDMSILDSDLPDVVKIRNDLAINYTNHMIEFYKYNEDLVIPKRIYNRYKDTIQMLDKRFTSVVSKMYER